MAPKQLLALLALALLAVPALSQSEPVEADCADPAVQLVSVGCTSAAAWRTGAAVWRLLTHCALHIHLSFAPPSFAPQATSKALELLNEDSSMCGGALPAGLLRLSDCAGASSQVR